MAAAAETMAFPETVQQCDSSDRGQPHCRTALNHRTEKKRKRIRCGKLRGPISSGSLPEPEHETEMFGVLRR